MADLVTLQRAAGNRTACEVLRQPDPRTAAVPSAPAPAPVTPGATPQLSMTSADLAAAASGPKDPYGPVRTALAAFEAASGSGRVMALEKLDQECFAWSNGAGRKTVSPLASRVRRLIDEIPAMQAQISREAAEAKYLDTLRTKKGDAGGFEALSTDAKLNTKATPKADAAQKLIKAHGLSEAEVAAIRAYTSSDYKYINPAVANSASWVLSSNESAGLKGFSSMVGGAKLPTRGRKAKKAANQATSMTDSAKSAVAEGALHAGIAMEGLKKLPAFTQDTYRGERLTKKAFKAKYAIGASFNFGAFGSSSWDREVAANFANGLGDNAAAPTKQQEIGVLQVITNSGGRDISTLSTVKGENEVLILPGSKFVVTSVAEIDGPTEFPTQLQELATKGFPPPKRWYLVKMGPVPKAKTGG